MTRSAAKKEPPKDVVEVLDVEQGSDEWKRLHIGVPSASNFATMMAGGEGKTRAALLRRMAGEVLSGEPAETYRSAAMARGNEMEPEARDWYARTRLVDLDLVGFVKRTVGRFMFSPPLVIGCSPDALIGERKILEVKTTMPEHLVAILEGGMAGFPPEHRAQCQGSLWVTGRDELDLMFFYRGFPVKPVFRMERDEAYIGRLAAEVERFDYDLRQLVKKIREMGS